MIDMPTKREYYQQKGTWSSLKVYSTEELLKLKEDLENEDYHLIGGLDIQYKIVFINFNTCSTVIVQQF